jgi:hypothetical protein
VQPAIIEAMITATSVLSENGCTAKTENGDTNEGMITNAPSMSNLFKAASR